MIPPTMRRALLAATLICAGSAAAAAQTSVGIPQTKGPPVPTRPIGPPTTMPGWTDLTPWGHVVPDVGGTPAGHTVPGAGQSPGWKPLEGGGWAPTTTASAMTLTLGELRAAGGLCRQKGGDGKELQEHVDFKPLCGRVASQIAFWLALGKTP